MRPKRHPVLLLYVITHFIVKEVFIIIATDQVAFVVQQN